ncbi:WD40 repeat-like protein [Myriangium duriaei CBS 260.36]|uniref:WD40 repeat-like protein n=1 Tax=Myriangium duriaei CBS 260.36 TaxID=1168546 RepID=A0A9P4ISY0_9PEZI|nr:WD40 repeat-like protein [Myriangium duriaei CBS 260.36]
MGEAAPPRKRDRMLGLLRRSKIPSSSNSRPPSTSRHQSSASSQARNDSVTALTASSPAPLTITPTTTIPTTYATNSLALSKRILDNVIKQLSDEERTAVEPHIDLNDQAIGATIQKAYNAVSEKQQVCKDKQWQWHFHGRVRVLRDEADKILYWLKRFKTVGDAVAGLDPVHVGLPWAVVNALLEVALADQEQMALLLTGMASALYASQRLQAYLEYLQRLPVTTKFVSNLEDSLINSYVHVLRFLAKAISIYNKRNKSTLQHSLQTFWTKGDIEDFEPQCEKLLSRLQADASIFDRELSARDRDLAIQSKEKLDRQRQDIERMKNVLDDLSTRIDLAKVPRAEGAMYGSHADEYLSHCLAGTREELIVLIENWIDDPGSKSIFWLCGMAGTGKSTISRTIARASLRRQRQGICLTASFFFRRGAGDRANASRFFPTLALQLADVDPIVRLAVAKAIGAEPALVEAKLKRQFQNLLVGPLEDLARHSTSPLTIVILIDALDECGGEDDMKMIMSLLMSFAQSNTLGHFTIRIFVTSRPEVPIQHKFYDDTNHDSHQDVRLEHVQADTIRRDIDIYLQYRLGEIRDEENIPNNWPGEDSIKILVDLACPLFIFAATMCRYISGRGVNSRAVVGGHPRKRLDSLLQQRQDRTLVGLDQMYAAILEQIFPPEDTYEYDEAIQEFHKLLGPLVVLASPLPISSLSMLLDSQPDEIFSTLKQLQAVLQVPTTVTDTAPIQALHASFPDYLLGPNSRKFHIDRTQTHTALAKQCLDRLCSTRTTAILKQDICNVGQPGTRRADIRRKQITNAIPADLAYACYYWTHHIAESKADDLIHDGGEVHNFLRAHFHHWLEALTWLGRLSSAFTYLDQLRTLLKAESSPDLSTFLDDASRFIHQYRYIIDMAPLQLYFSALWFVPKSSIIGQTFHSDISNLTEFELVPEAPTNWSKDLQKLEGHQSYVRGVVYHPNGKIIASGAYDNTVRLWDTSTGEQLHTFEMKESALDTAFSHDGETIAVLTYSGSTVNSWSVRTWSVRTGEQLQEFEGDDGAVEGITYTSSGDIFSVLGSGERSINIVTGASQELMSSPSRVDSIIWSTDGQMMVIASWDLSVQVYDTHTWERVRNFPGRDTCYNCVSYTPDGKKVIFATSYENTRAVQDGEGTVASFEEHDTHEASLYNTDCANPYRASHSGKISAVGQSPTGSTVKLIAQENSLRLYKIDQTGTAEIVQQFEAYEDQILAATLSANNECVVSASRDGTIRIWNSWTGHELQNIVFDEHNIETVAYAPANKMLALALDGNTIRLHDSATGEDTQTLTIPGYNTSIHSLAFSHDGRSLLSTSDDRMVRIWDVSTGDQKLDLCLRGQWPCAAFSIDGQEIAHVSDSGKLIRWSLVTGKEIDSSNYYDSKVSSLALSQDKQLLAMCTKMETILLLDASSGRELYRLEQFCDGISDLAFSPDGDSIAVASRDDNIYLLDTATGELIRTFEGHDAMVSGVAFSPDGKNLASSSSDHTVRLWNIQDYCDEQELKSHGVVTELSFSPNGQVVAEIGIGSVARLWDPLSGRMIGQLDIEDSVSLTDTVFSPSGYTVALATDAGTVQLWDVRTCQKIHDFVHDAERVRQISFSSDGTLMATTTYDLRIRLWDIHKREKKLVIYETKLEKHNSITTVALSYDNSLIATILNEYIVRIRDAHTGRSLHQFGTRPAKFYELAFAPDRPLLAAITENGTIACWNTDTGDLTLKLRPDDSLIEPAYGTGTRLLAFSPSGVMVAAVARGNGIHIWNVRTEAEILRVDIGSSIDELKFAQDGKILYTNLGAFELDFSNIASSEGSSAERITIELQDQWVRHGGRDLLWLPTGYRGRRTAVYGKTLATCQHSGTVSFFRLCDSASLCKD